MNDQTRTQLDMANSNLIHMIPFKVAEAKSILIINLSGNRLISLASLGQFKNLQSLNISHNRVSSIDLVAASLAKSSLTELNIRGNPIQEDSFICM
jgi:Leucine-rich repeat (LRR) protein